MLIVHPDGVNALYLIGAGSKPVLIPNEEEFWKLSAEGIRAIPIGKDLWTELQR